MSERLRNYIDVYFIAGEKITAGDVLFVSLTQEVVPPNTFGYFMGGDSGGGSNTALADKFGYSSEITTAKTTANLTSNKQGAGSVSDNYDGIGYVAGGYTLSQVSSADKVFYPVDVTYSQTSANLSQARYYLVGVGDDLNGNGYFVGGWTSSVLTTADKLTYSTNTTAALTTANLTQARGDHVGLSYTSGGNGYFLGGYSSSDLDSAEKLNYSTEITTAQTSANLSQARQDLAGTTYDSGGVGYVAGGSTSFTRVTSADKVVYSTDTTTSKTTANLSQARFSMGAIAFNSGGKGFFGGGQTAGSTSQVSTMDKLTFSTETTAVLSTSSLTQARSYLTGLSGSDAPWINPIITLNNGYFLGGASSTVPTAVNLCNEISFSTDTTIALTTGNLSQARWFATGLSSIDDYEGYVLGGVSSGTTSLTTTNRMSYNVKSSNASLSSNLPVAIHGAAGLSNRSGGKGYVCGGFSSAYTTAVYKIIFANEVTSAQTASNISQARGSYPGNVSSNIDGKGYIAGGTTNNAVTTADKLIYSTEISTAQTSANLTVERHQPASLSNETNGKGYFLGGYSTVQTALTDKIIYSTEVTAAATTANLSQVRQGAAGISNNPNGVGYAAGGNTNAATLVTTCDKVTYSTDVTAAQTTGNLSTIRYRAAPLSCNSV